MMLIDADRPLNLLKDDLHVFETMTSECEKGISYGIRIALGRIDGQPIIRPESLRVHGMWYDKPPIIWHGTSNIPVVQCSECGITFCDIINNHHYMYRYCSHCGARMDKEGNNDTE